MYTEYIFENKKYEVALRDLKATLFDIVTRENANVGKLRQRTAQAKDGEQQRELEELCERQDACLRDIITLTSNLEDALQRVDSCSRDLKQIENENIAQIVAMVHEEKDASMAKEEVYPQEFISDDVYQPGVVVENEGVYEDTNSMDLVTGDMSHEEMVPSIPEASEVVEEAPMEVTDEGDAMAVAAEQKALEESQETPAEEASEVAAPVEDVVMTYDDSLSTVSEAENTEVAEGVETPSEEATVVEEAPTETAVPEIVPAETPATEEAAPAEEATTNGEEAAPTRLILPIINKPAEEGPVLTTVAEGETAPADGVTAPAEANATNDLEDKLKGLILPIIKTPGEEGPVLTPAAETEAAPTEVVETPSTNGPVIEVPTVSTPVIEVPTGDAPVIETPTASTPVIEIPTGGSPVIETPAVEGTEENTQIIHPDDRIVETLHFKKRSTDSPKVIMISGRQASNLRGSCATQEALLSAKGMFGDKEISASDLVDGDDITRAKQAQIEQMMQQANQLYSEGKVEAAQNMYNQISILNKELQEESAGISK